MTMGQRGPGSTPPGPRTGRSFTDGVMARVAKEPTPSPGRAFIRALRRLALRDALSAVATAWRLAFEPATPVAASARASAAALFLSVVVLVGLGGAFVTSGVISVLGPDDPRLVQPGPAAAPSATPTAVPTPSPTPSPTPLVTPPAVEPAQPQREQRTQRETPAPKEPKTEQKERRETPEPREREREKDDDRERDDD